MADTMPTGEQVDAWLEDTLARLFPKPKHSYDLESPLTRTLNVARRNGSPYQPRHCNCPPCKHGFTHIAQVI